MVRNSAGVITDWGGVLTTPILTTVQASIQADGMELNRAYDRDAGFGVRAYDPNGSRTQSTRWSAASVGREFEQILAAQLFRVDGGPPRGCCSACSPPARASRPCTT